MVKFEKKDYLLAAIMGVLLFLLYCFHINKLDTICIIGDEFGYWSTGAFLAGLDWSEVASYNPYYSYGYGLWLMIIIRLFPDSILAYKAAILLNAIFIVVAYAILIGFSIKYLEITSKKVAVISSFAVMLFAGTFFSAQTTQCETVFALFYIIEVVLLYQYLKNSRKIVLILLWTNAIYLYLIHQRALVVIIALIMVLIVHTIFCTKKWKDLILGFGIAAILWMLCDMGKDIILEKLYLGGQAVYSNNYAGQVGKLEMLLTAEGMKKFIISLLGKVYYLGVSTFGIFYIGIFVCLKDIWKGILAIKNKEKILYREVGALFLVLMFLGTIGISTIQLMDNTRIDTLIYGRYSEYIIQPIILYGLFWIFYNKKSKGLLPVLLMQIILAGLMCYQLESENYSLFYPNNVSAIGVLYYDVWEKSAFICYAVIITNIVITIMYLFLKKGSGNTRKIIITTGVVAAWFFLGFSAADRQLYIFSDEGSDLELYSFFKELPEEMEVYYCPSDSTDSFAYLNADYLQYIAFEKKILMLDQPLSKVEVLDKDFLVISDSANMDLQWLESYVVLEETPHFKLLANKESEAAEYYIYTLGESM